MQEGDNGGGSIAQLSKALVRYALACEYSWTPIRRQDVGQKGICFRFTFTFMVTFMFISMFISVFISMFRFMFRFM